jgi:hypothetical protein
MASPFSDSLRAGTEAFPPLGTGTVGASKLTDASAVARSCHVESDFDRIAIFAHA